MEIKELPTEQRNPASMRIDQMTAAEIVKTINDADQTVAEAVKRASGPLAEAIDQAADHYRRGGRLIYMGAGSSGRLGVLDAVELVPTYGISPDRAVGLLAGGPGAMFKAVEGAEDRADLGQKDLQDLKLKQDDVVIGLAASGRTPYVLGGLDYASRVGALTIAVACVSGSLIGQRSQIAIEAVTGPEVITGSTRMKAGTAQKMILNALSTGIMIKQGKVYQNVMIAVKPTNQKLVDRAIRIIMTVADVDQEAASAALAKSKSDVPAAIVMLKRGCGLAEAAQLLKKHQGNVADVIKLR